ERREERGRIAQRADGDRTPPETIDEAADRLANLREVVARGAAVVDEDDHGVVRGVDAENLPRGALARRGRSFASHHAVGTHIDRGGVRRWPSRSADL